MMAKSEKRVLLMALAALAVAGGLVAHRLATRWPQSGYLEKCDRFSSALADGDTAEQIRTWASNSWWQAKQPSTATTNELEPGAALLTAADAARLYRPMACKPCVGPESDYYVWVVWRHSLADAWWFLSIGPTNYVPSAKGLKPQRCAPGIHFHLPTEAR